MDIDINTLILNALQSKSLYGLEIIKKIQDNTNGELVLKQPSLYSALRRLETKKMVSSYWEDSELGGKRHYYTITKLGLEILKEKQEKQEIQNRYLERQSEQYENLDYISEFSPTKTENSFSDVMKQYVQLKNDYPQENFETQAKTEEQFEELLFPDVDDDLPLPMDIHDDEKEINYKDILGDFLVEEKPVKKDLQLEPIKQTFKKTEPEKQVQTDETTKILNKGREHAKKIAEILSGKNDNSFKSNQTDAQQKLLEEISKRHKDEDVLSSTNQTLQQENNTYERTPLSEINYQPVKREKTKYLFINKINFHSQLIIFLIMLVEICVMFGFYMASNFVDVEQYIIFGVALFVALLSLVISFSVYKFYPNKKVGENIKWGRNFLCRLFVTILLVACVISINLIIGMDAFTRYDYLLRWLLPSLIVFNIFIKWFFNFILAKKEKYKI